MNGGPPGAGLDVAVLDYRMSNLRSASKALVSLGADVRVVRDGSELGSPDAVILPGVGHFGEAMTRMRAAGLDLAARRAADEGRGILGICLGLQLLFERSDEAPGIRGLGLIRGAVERLVTSEKVPHIGWSRVVWDRRSVLSPRSEDAYASTYYFVHSYACVPESAETVLGRADHGAPFVAAAGTDMVQGVQFHPEKSSDAGLELLARWLEFVRRTSGADTKAGR